MLWPRHREERCYPRLRSVLKWCAIGIAVSVAAALLLATWLNRSRPKGVPGPAADQLARSIERAVNKPAWDQTGAVNWALAGQHELLWDRNRSLLRAKQEDLTIWVDLATHDGVATRGAEALTGQALRSVLDEAYSWWINDSFWLNPLAKLFDEGVERRVVIEEGQAPQLLVTYRSGGQTPGDAYLWTLGPDGKPKAWRMWVSVLPIGGLSVTWQGWQQLQTGAWVSTSHELGPFSFGLSHLRAAATLAQLIPGPDPFRRLLADEQSRAASPTSSR